MSNFDFLKDFDETLWKLGNRIEKQINISPSGVKADSTTFLEHILKDLLTSVGLKYNSRKTFYEQLDAVYRKGKISYGYKQKIYKAYNLRHHIHDNFEDIEKNEYFVALELHEKLFYIAKKYYRDYSDSYDEYRGVPSYKSPELDMTSDEVELIRIPDFNEIIEVEYDYCVICGEPNHSNYSIHCPKCNREMDNANNFISIRNNFGKDSTFTKEDIIEFGIPEGYANQLINYLVEEKLVSVKGRFISFNNRYLDDYLAKIAKYLAVGDLITKFREDKITPKDIKQTKEYKQGSFRQFPFYQFYKIINEEIVNKFESDLLSTGDVHSSIEYTTISQKDINRWYLIQLGQYKKGNVNESFVVYNNVLKEEYLDLKRQGIPEKEIKSQLNVTDDMYEFWSKNNDFTSEIHEIKKELLLKALSENKTRDEAIEFAGISQKEYNDLVKYSDYKQDEFSQKRNKEIEARKERFVEYLKSNDLKTSCRMAKISVDDFYEWYDGADLNSKFYIDSTHVLMDRFLDERKKGKTKKEAIAEIGIKEKYVNYWLKRNLEIFDKFKNNNVKVTVDLILEGFEKDKSKKEISKFADVSVKTINTYLKLGQRGYGTYKKLFDYYEEVVIPKQLYKLLDEIKNKSIKKALENVELSKEAFDYCCELGRRGDKKFKDFYDKYYSIKLNIFLSNVNKGKSTSKALRNADLTEDEVRQCYELGENGDERFTEFYEKYFKIKFGAYTDNIIAGKSQGEALKISKLNESDLPDNIDEVILDKQLGIVTTLLKKDFTTKNAARKANVSVNDVFDWFLKGRNGDEKFKEFSQFYYEEYVSPGSKIVQRSLNDGNSIDMILRIARNHLTREDYDFWYENGFLEQAQKELDKEKEKEDENEELKEELMDS